ncbi:hypothetical protein HRbin15_01956 [bacterium HR15]|nr:hypothetical protein HRbin15_01956 [bacterium HR15]
MRAKSIVYWWIFVLVGCCPSYGQSGFRYPVGESVYVSAFASALRNEQRSPISRPITSEVACAAGTGAAVLDQYSSDWGPPTIGGGRGSVVVGAQADSTSTARGNKAWITAYGYGTIGAEAVAMVSNDCWDFALEVAGSGGGSAAEFQLPFIMPERGPVAIILDWMHLVGSSSGASGQCGGLFAEPSFDYTIRAGFSVSILDSEGRAVFYEEFLTDQPNQKHIWRTLVLPPGRYLLIGTNSSYLSATSIAVVSPDPSSCGPCCMSCTMSGTAASAPSLAVYMVAFRSTIPVPLDAVRSDIDGSYSVDDGDLLSVIVDYGHDGRESLADINGDGLVDDADILMVLQWFGTEY